VERRASRYGQQGKTFAIKLGCELRHANRLEYSEGLDVPGDNATQSRPGAGSAEGTTVLSQRFPALGRELDRGEQRSTVSPYVVKQP